MHEWPVDRDLDEKLRHVVNAEVAAADPRQIVARSRSRRTRSRMGAGLAVAAVAALVAALLVRPPGRAPVGETQPPTAAPSASPSASPTPSLGPSSTLTPGFSAGPTADPASTPGGTPPCGGDGILVPLSDGRVLAVGNGCGSAIYDPATRTFTSTGTATTGRYQPTGTLLRDGRVLIAGGDGNVEGPATDEIFDPRSGRFTPIGNAAPANPVVSVLLPSGRVLLVGAEGDSDLFDPEAGTFAATAPMTGAGKDAQVRSAAPLGDGRVMVVAVSAGNVVDARIYDPVSNSFEPTPKTVAPRDSNASLAGLHDGRVMLFGGGSSIVEAYDPASGTFSQLASMPGAAEVAGYATLTDGRVLAIVVAAQEEGSRRPAGLFDVLPAGGRHGPPAGATIGLVLAGEIYDPGADRWTDLGRLDLEWIADYGAAVTNLHLVAPLPGGGALVTGTTFGGGPDLVELFDPRTGKFTLLG